MDTLSAGILEVLLRTAAMQMLAWLLLAGLIQRMKLASPGSVRLACACLLVPACLLLPLSIAIPWYAPENPAESMAEGLDVQRHARATGGQASALVEDAGHTQPNHQDGLAPGDGTAARAAAETGSLQVDPKQTFRILGRLLVLAWAAGTLAALLGPVVAYVRFVRCLAPPLPSSDARVGQWHEALRRAGVNRPIPLRLSREAGPMLCLLPGGYCLVVPQRLWCAISRTEQSAILAHEAAHCRRGDVWKSWLIRSLAAPYWFSPAALWAARTFDECAELCCDRWAAPTPAERVDYAKTLQRLAGLRQDAWAVGACAHGHPLVSRVRLLLTSPMQENHAMKRMILLGAVGALMIGHSVRVQLVAQEPADGREMARQRIEQLDAAMDELAAKVEEAEAAGEALKDKVSLRLDELKAMAADPAGFPEDVQWKIQAVQSVVEAEQLKAIDGAAELGDGGTIVLAYAAAESPHPKVRKAALEAAVAMKEAGLPVISHAFDKLPDDEKRFLIEQLAKGPSVEQLFALLMIAHESEGEVHEAALKAGTASEHRVLFTALLAKHSEPERMGNLVDVAAGFEGNDGLLLLYAAAGHGTPEVQVAAIETAARRGLEGLPVVKPAFKSQDPAVRAAIVRAAKQIGGPIGEAVIGKAMQDPDEALRDAAAEALDAPDEADAAEAEAAAAEPAEGGAEEAEPADSDDEQSAVDEGQPQAPAPAEAE